MLQYNALLLIASIAAVSAQTTTREPSTLLELDACSTWYPLGGNSQPLDTLPYTALCSPTPDGKQIIMQIVSSSTDVSIVGVVATAVHSDNTAWTHPTGSFGVPAAGYTAVSCKDKSESLVKDDYSAVSVFSQSWNIPVNALLTDVKCRFLIAQSTSVYWNDVIVPSVSEVDSSPVIGGDPSPVIGGDPQQQQTKAPLPAAESTSTAPGNADAVSDNTTTPSTVPVANNLLPDLSSNNAASDKSTTELPVSVTTTHSSLSKILTSEPAAQNVPTTEINTLETSAAILVEVAGPTGAPETTAGPVTTGALQNAGPTTADLIVTDSDITGVTVTGSTVTGTTVTGSTVTGFTATGSTVTGSTATDSIATDSTTAGPKVAHPTTAGPTTAGPTTVGPTTAGPTTEGPTTEGPTTTRPTTAGPTTAGPTTAGFTAAGPTTAGPTATDAAATGSITAADPTATGSTTTAIPILPKRDVKKKVFGRVTSYWCNDSGSIYVPVPDSKCSAYYSGIYANSMEEFKPHGEFKCGPGTKFSTIICGCDWSHKFICPESQ